MSKTATNRPPARPAAGARPRPSRDAKTSASKMPWIIAALVVVIGLAGLVAVMGTGDEATGSGTETADVKVTGDALPSTGGASGLIATASDAAVGKTIPVLSGSTPTGSAISYAPAGKPTVYVFAAHWCPHCQKELPLIQKWLDNGDLGSDVLIRTVSTSVQSNATNYPPSAWLTKIKWTGQIMVDSAGGTAAKAFGLESFPYILFVDGQGVVKQRGTGELTLDEMKAGIAAIGTSAG